MKKFSVILFSFSFLIVVLSACNKQTGCQASITCHDAQGQPLKGVEVRLFANVKHGITTTVADVKATGVTDQNGKVTFAFKLPAIFDISASVGTATATSIIKLEDGKTTEKAVEVK